MKNKSQKYKTDWDLNLLYSDKNSETEIRADLAKSRKLFADFNRKYAGKDDYLNDENKLFKVLTDYESLIGETLVEKPYLYYYYKTDLNAFDTDSVAKRNLMEAEYTKQINEILFLETKFATISGVNQQKFLKSKKLAHFNYFLKNIFRKSAHTLSEKEEKILNLKTLTSYSLWISGTEKILNEAEVNWKNKKIPLNQALLTVRELETTERRKLYRLINQKLLEISPFAENELNAIVLDKKNVDEIRNYKKPYSETIIGYQNDEKTVETLVKVVNENMKIAHRFFKVKAKLLGLKKLEYADRWGKIGKINKKFEFDEALKITKTGFGEVNKIYSDILENFIQNGQIDVFPKKGKTSGAYCSPAINFPTLVLLNHNDDLNSVTTLAHEMGHAIHSELSHKHQTNLYKHHTISVAEVASTLFENFVFDNVIQTLNDKEKIIALHDRISDSIATIFRQIACFNFELKLHTIIREKGFVTKAEIAKLMNIEMKKYLGGAFDLQDDDGYFFVTWSHIRRFFYVYSYAIGKLTSDALYNNYKKDKNFEIKIREFLSAGGQNSPEGIFKNIGIDITKPEFFRAGLKEVEEQIIKLEKLTKKWEKQ